MSSNVDPWLSGGRLLHPLHSPFIPQLTLRSDLSRSMKISPRWGGGVHPNSRALPTCVNPLPAHGEGGPGLDEVIGDGTAVVPAATPRQLGRAVCHFLHRHGVRRAGGAWLSHRNTHTHAVRHSHMSRNIKKKHTHEAFADPNQG